MTTWTHNRKEEDGPMSLSEKLFAEADQEDRLGEQYKGCSFVGEHPSMVHCRRASLLRQAAMAALRTERADESRREKNS